MDSMKDLLGKYNPAQPDEIVAIKRFIADEFKATASVGLQGETIVITVASASLANALRFKLPALQKAAGTEKRIMFRIG